MFQSIPCMCTADMLTNKAWVDMKAGGEMLIWKMSKVKDLVQEYKFSIKVVLLT